MSARAKVTLTALVVAAALGFSAPLASADDDPAGAAARDDAPPITDTAGKPAKSERLPEQQSAPAVPSGCPFRQGKLELLV